VNWRLISVGAGMVGCFYGLLACRAARVEEVPGRYRVEAEWGESTLTLREDRTMVQEIKLRDGETKSVFGSWSIDDWLVMTKPCLVISRESHRLHADVCGYPPEVIFMSDSVHLWIDSDNGFAYRKIPNN